MSSFIQIGPLLVVAILSSAILGGGVYECLVIDRCWPNRPDLINRFRRYIERPNSVAVPHFLRDHADFLPCSRMVFANVRMWLSLALATMQWLASGLLSISSPRLLPSSGLPQSIRHLRKGGRSEAGFVYRLLCSLLFSCYAHWWPLSRSEGMKRKTESVTDKVERIEIALRGIGEQIALMREMITSHFALPRTDRAGLDFVYSRGGACTAGDYQRPRD